ncbi:MULTISPECIES: C40 family peptidase [unclassified Nocardioides]|uniref:C40 family peptidase n=1 Tax=unclassified Nocardioides TaxID=2615069 RepID=UPI0000571277|nr:MULTISPECIES: C40 family peptidase [unclassified Nocardioides]ABL82626.1 NLP/P60 protein [Nocardioides sp. JS614]
MQNGRNRLITLLTGFALIAAVGFMPSSPASAEPDIDDVQARVDRLYLEAEQASERYNDAKLELKELQRDLGSLRADQERQDDRLDVVRQQVQDSVVRQYEGQNLSAVGQVVVSDDPEAFLSQLSTMSAFNDLQSQLFDDYATELKALGIRSDATEKRAGDVAALEKKLAAEKATIDKNLEAAESLLSDLKAQEREDILSRGSLRVPSDVPVSGRAAAAVQYALAQVGDAYVYGAAGPNAFDCSGLTMMAWAQAGVALPHSSSAQYGSGPHIASSDLQPGDLVFYYSPISHVGIYIGNGMIVHAANPSTGVVVSSVFSMPYSGAVRPG